MGANFSCRWWAVPLADGWGETRAASERRGRGKSGGHDGGHSGTEAGRAPTRSWLILKQAANHICSEACAEKAMMALFSAFLEEHQNADRSHDGHTRDECERENADGTILEPTRTELFQRVLSNTVPVHWLFLFGRECDSSMTPAQPRVGGTAARSGRDRRGGSDGSLPFATVAAIGKCRQNRPTQVVDSVASCKSHLQRSVR